MEQSSLQRRMGSVQKKLAYITVNGVLFENLLQIAYFVCGFLRIFFRFFFLQNRQCENWLSIDYCQYKKNLKCVCVFLFTLRYL